MSLQNAADVFLGTWAIRNRPKATNYVAYKISARKVSRKILFSVEKA